MTIDRIIRELREIFSSDPSGKHRRTNGQLICRPSSLGTYYNSYQCPNCGLNWHDEHEAMPDDDCMCGQRHVSPWRSVDLDTPFDQRQALLEGWCISWTDTRARYEIQRDDDNTRFGSDEEAVDYVAGAVALGNAYHCSAQAWLDHRNG